jgi:hypothetical protein
MKYQFQLNKGKQKRQISSERVHNSIVCIQVEVIISYRQTNIVYIEKKRPLGDIFSNIKETPSE